LDSTFSGSSTRPLRSSDPLPRLPDPDSIRSAESSPPRPRPDPLSDPLRPLLPLVDIFRHIPPLAMIPLFILWIDLLWLIVLSAALLIRFKPVRLYAPE
jgi:hypothetical protein